MANDNGWSELDADRAWELAGNFHPDNRGKVVNAIYDWSRWHRTRHAEELARLRKVAEAAEYALSKFGDEYPGRLGPLEKALAELDGGK